MKMLTRLMDGVGTGASLAVLLGAALLMSRGRPAPAPLKKGTTARAPIPALQTIEPPANFLDLCREAGL